MKTNFKYIVIFIISALCIVFLIQLFWLKGLYTSIQVETEKNIFDCVNMANSHELEFRMDSLDNSPDKKKPHGEISISQSIGDNDSEKTDTSDSKKMVKTKRIVQQGDTIQDSKEEFGDEQFSLAQFEKLGGLIREAVHQTIDTVIPITLDTLHSSLVLAFKSKGIQSEIYNIEVVNFEKDSVMRSLYVAKNDKTPYIFDYTYDSENQLGYRIHCEPLTKTILSQMFGILSTTALIILILAFAFWYLIRTIFQQKTLDEMKADFTNNMTHELKTPIAVAYAATDALLNFGQDENKERREKYLTINKEQLGNLSNLVEQILSMSMEQRLNLNIKREDIQLKQMLEVIIEQHKLKTEREIVFHIDIQPQNLIVSADKGHLNNVISNLIDNAIKYSKDNTVIDIVAYSENKYNIIKIKDNGIGIATDKQKFLFEKFYRVPQGNKYNVKGYGIGLFYVKTIIEKHGGTISVASSLGKGSEFIVKIPIK